MPDPAEVVVTNTTPLIALVAATGGLDILRAVYAKVIVPYEVVQEIKAGGKDFFGLDVFHQSSWLTLSQDPVKYRLEAALQLPVDVLMVQFGQKASPFESIARAKAVSLIMLQGAAA